jgi:hypothetical protein
MSTKAKSRRSSRNSVKADVSGSASLKLKHIVIIGKFDDGKCRQVLINHKTQDVVLSAVVACEQQIRVLETIIEGIDIELPS